VPVINEMATPVVESSFGAPIGSPGGVVLMGTAGLPIALSILSEGALVYQCFGPSISGQKKTRGGPYRVFSDSFRIPENASAVFGADVFRSPETGAESEH
jgi:hypothetical protein